MAVVPDNSAYFDESRLEENFPVVAGFCNPVDLWIVCEEKLRDALRHKPEGLAAKKYVRGHSLEFAKILSVFTLHPICATMEKVALRHLWKFKGMGEDRFANAYASCSWACCEMLDDHAISQGWRKPIKVVFDDGAAGKIYLERGYRDYYAKKENSLLSKVPIFEDDEEVLPILAADLYAWLLARHYNATLVGEEIEALNLIHQGRPLGLIINQETVRQGIQKKGSIYLQAVPLEWISEPDKQQLVRQILSDNRDKLRGIGSKHEPEEAPVPLGPHLKG
jgi:hypothetical protein